MAQRLYSECLHDGHNVFVHEYESTDMMIHIASQSKYDLIICPYLTKKVPKEIFENHSVPCWIVHPGIEGDRGISSLDWALLEHETTWGVTVLQAVEAMDAGPIWDTQTFDIPHTIRGHITKSALYRWSCIDAASVALKNAIHMFMQGM